VNIKVCFNRKKPRCQQVSILHSPRETYLDSVVATIWLRTLNLGEKGGICQNVIHLLWVGPNRSKRKERNRLAILKTRFLMCYNSLRHIFEGQSL